MDIHPHPTLHPHQRNHVGLIVFIAERMDFETKKSYLPRKLMKLLSKLEDVVHDHRARKYSAYLKMKVEGPTLEVGSGGLAVLVV
jgi:hypothetical protein